MPKTRPVQIGGVTHPVGRMTMADIDALDDFLATLPKPSVNPSDVLSLRQAIDAIVEPIARIGADGVDPAQQAILLLNLRTQLAKEAGYQLESLNLAAADWPPQVMSERGSDLLVRLAAGRRLVFHRALLSGDPGISRAAADALYDTVDVMEYKRVEFTFFGAEPAEAEESAAGPKGGAGGGGDGTGTTSTTPSPAPTAGGPSGSTP